MYHYISAAINCFILVFFMFFLLEKKSVKFNFARYLATLNQSIKNELSPYMKGVFVLGMMVPVSFWFVFDFIGDGFFNKSNEMKNRAATYIGACDTDNACWHKYLHNKSINPDDLISTAQQIKIYMFESMNNESNDRTKKGN